MPNWDADSPELDKNLRDVLDDVVRHAQQREPLTLAQIRQWHAAILIGLDLPDPAFAGNFRGDPSIDSLRDYEVWVPPNRGAPANRVAKQLADLEQAITASINQLDALVPTGEAPPDEDTLDAIIDLCAAVHAHWVRIHPFFDGNGRTARLLANWVALRYGLPPFVRLRPRPDGDQYAFAGHMAMALGVWEPTAEVFRDMLDLHMEEWES